jgi:hypothetical protein
MRTTTLAAVVLGLSLIGCRGGGGGGDDDGDDDGPNPDGPPGGEVTIQQVQSDAMPEGTPVELKGVVVTAIDIFGSRTGDIWVQEPEGGEFSGVKVFGAPLDVVANLKPGDVVDISNAEKDEFFITQDTSGRTVTEIKGAGGGTMTLVPTGATATATVTTVDAALIDALATEAERDAEWEKWEGVLVNVINVRQTSPEDTFGAGGDDQHAFDASGGLVVESSLASLGTNAVGTCYASITGVGDYAFDYLLLPRATADIMAGGTGCTAEPIPTPATIAEVQAGTKTGLVEIKGVFVSAKAFAAANQQPRSFWIASSPTAAPNEGVFVFGNVAVDPALVVGSKVDIIATVQEFNDDANGGTLTELTQPQVTILADPAATVVPLAKTAADLVDPTNGPTFESVLVTLTNVELTTVGNAMNGFVATAKQGVTTFKMGTDAVRFTAGTSEGCYATIVGLGTNLQAAAAGATTKPNSLGFIPVTLGAKTAGACP